MKQLTLTLPSKKCVSKQYLDMLGNPKKATIMTVLIFATTLVNAHFFVVSRQPGG